MSGSDTISETDLPVEVQRLIEQKGNCWPYLPLLYEEAKKAETILEIGVGAGRSTKTLLCGCRDGRGGLLRSIDWNRAPATREAAENIRNMGINKYWDWIQRDFFDMPDEWFTKHPVDLVWIDIGASAGRSHYEMVRKCSLSLKTGSRLLLHNICHNPQARQDLFCFIEPGGYEHEERLELNGLGIITKI